MAVPNGAERVLAIAEAQLAHARELERQVVSANIAQAWLGQVLAFTLASGVSAGGFYHVMLGKDASGIAAIIGALAGLVGAFVYGRWSHQKERTGKRQDLMGAKQGRASPVD